MQYTKVYATFIIIISQQLNFLSYVTGSVKTGLIAHDRKLNILWQTRSHINTLSSFIAKMK